MTQARHDIGLIWFRRDLRMQDNAALYHALKQCRRLYCVFVFDTDILAALPRQDRRVVFIWDSLVQLNAALAAHGGGLIVRHGKAAELVPALAQELHAQAVFANHDYEPAAVARDAAVATALAGAGRALRTFKDQVIFERAEVLTAQGKPYGVFTPYKNNWLAKVNDFYLKVYPVQTYAHALVKPPVHNWPSLESMGFDADFRMPVAAGADGAHVLFDEFLARMDGYHDTRDFPAVKGPSYLSVHLRFGTISIRTLARAAWQRVMGGGMAGSANGVQGAQTWLSELIWRDFYFQVLHHHPRVATHAFKSEYDRIVWDNDPALFAAWCEGRTGYPLVDAAMIQLNTTGYMHNRLRMVTASFLTKDLGIDWRWGEKYFAEKLNDFDLSANNGGWQWAASSGCDAQPYFRIFNPISQSEKFDAQGKFIKRYLPQLAKFDAKQIHAPWMVEPMLQRAAGCSIGTDYPAPVVDHATARARTLERYAVVKRAVSEE
ncbi:MAG: cryptochrome/photolyase family protein [Burkholderiaceae bacterium]